MKKLTFQIRPTHKRSHIFVLVSVSETGHIKNVENFKLLINYCTQLGAAYAPSYPAILLAALGTLQTIASAALALVMSEKQNFANAVNARQIIFASTKALATRIIAVLKSSGATQQIINDAKSILRKIRGQRLVVPPVSTDPTNPTNTNSVSQQSFDKLLEHFTALFTLVKNEPLYVPNEVELQIATLQTLITDLTTQNDGVKNQTTIYVNTLIARNHLLYDPATGLVDIAQSVKEYFKSVFGSSSEEFKYVSKIKFRRYKP